MDNNKSKLNIWKIILIGINIIGIICLIYFGALYLSFDQTCANPDAMLPFKNYEIGGFAVLFGIFPMILANTLAFIFIKTPKLPWRLLFFVPAIICVALGTHYFIKDTTEYNDKENIIFVVAIDVQTDDDVYAVMANHGLGDEVLGGCAVSEASFTPLSGSNQFDYYPEDFPEGTDDYSNFFVDIKVWTDGDDSSMVAEDKSFPVDTLHINAEPNKCYKYVLTGNQVDGYQLEAVAE